jgi:phosphoribosylformylglycinamidine synthase
MMFAQANSEHCRHKIFNSSWTIDGQEKEISLFGMIRNTHKVSPDGVLSAYSDNAAVFEGYEQPRLWSDADSNEYAYHIEPIHVLIKVETHNHPTAISPFPGAATGSGGEIRDEGATGRGSKPKAGLNGFSVSNLRIPGAEQPWEGKESKPDRIASPLQIMLEGPIGGAAFNNEFGRPNITGYFRTFEQHVDGEMRGYHKPIMLAGGMGNIREQHVEKNIIPDGAHIVVLGGPAMLIGLGGGAASSVATGSSSEDLDFASVQRGNPEMQRRCQEVIHACTVMGENNPIVSIHDVGAGGLCNAVPELVGDAEKGGHFQLREVLNEEPGMTPMQIWCNEAQERYTLAVMPEDLETFKAICERERCLYCVVGHATDEQSLVLDDAEFDQGSEREQKPIDLPMDLLFGKPPKMLRDVKRDAPVEQAFDHSSIDIKEALYRVLKLPAVADKTFLVTIGDRSVTGMICRDQMVGRWQVPVADVAITSSSYTGVTGEAMSLGERTPLASINAPASGRMAIAEALTNMAAANIRNMSEIKLSANWMAAANHPGDDAALYETVEAVGMEICPELGISIPVGKDSMSMKTVWQDRETNKPQSVTSPVSLIVTAFGPVDDVSKTVTPSLNETADGENYADNELLFLDIAQGKTRLSLSALAQVYQQVGVAQECPDVDDAAFLKSCFLFLQSAIDQSLITAYHDRSDGGLIATLLEMAFASRCGLDIDLPHNSDAIATLFNEELGAVLYVSKAKREALNALAGQYSISSSLHVIGHANASDEIMIRHAGKVVVSENRIDCHRAWSETTYQMQKLRDNPECAQQEYDRLLDKDEKGLYSSLSFDVNDDIAAPFIQTGVRPKVAILREQGVNGHMEMAASFTHAGFDAVDVTMSDLIAGRVSLEDFNGLAACGGFSYGDVLGAGEGWAKTVLYNNALRDQFSAYFERQDAFTLGICNGCQMVSNLKDIIPGATHWPHFVKNKSEQYEARVIQAHVHESNSVFLAGMAGATMP